jgi:tetratricopeptide (TPR) repeat protein
MTYSVSRTGGSSLAAGALGAALLAAALAGSGFLALRIEPQVSVSTGLSASMQENIEKSASASLFGQFRSSMADFLWLKVDKYTHSGVDLRGLTEQEKANSSADKVASGDGGKENGNREHRGDETTVIPSADNDWRGFYGNLEREVQPYQGMDKHSHRDPKESLPLFRLMTWSNPHFISGYTVGAAMIARDRTKLDDAIAFLKEGLTNNPDSIEIASDLGAILTTRKREYTQAMPYLMQAIRSGQIRDIATLTDDERDAYQAAFRWTVLNRREAKDLSVARAAAEAGLKLFPEDVVCRHYLESVTKKPG